MIVMDEERMTVEDVLRVLNISRPTLSRLQERGTLKPLPGNPVLLKQPRLYFRRADVERLLAADE